MHLRSLTNRELSQHAEGVADSELEKELLRRFDVLLGRLAEYERYSDDLLCTVSENAID